MSRDEAASDDRKPTTNDGLYAMYPLYEATELFEAARGEANRILDQPDDTPAMQFALAQSLMLTTAILKLDETVESLNSK